MRLILWDLDGTIQDSEPLAQAGTQYGFRAVLGRDPTEAELAQLLGQPIAPLYRQWFGPEIAEQLLLAGSRYYAEHAHRIACFPGVVDVLRALQAASYRLGLVSSKRRIHVNAELSSHGLDALFDIVVAQEDCTRHKPDPEPLLRAAHLLGISPDQALYVGDQPSDIVAAQRAGMKSIGVLWSNPDASRFNGCPPTMLAHTAAEVLTVVAALSDRAG